MFFVNAWILLQCVGERLQVVECTLGNDDDPRVHTPCSVVNMRKLYDLPHPCVVRPRTEEGSNGGARDDNVDFSTPVPVGGDDLRRIARGRPLPPRAAACAPG